MGLIRSGEWTRSEIHGCFPDAVDAPAYWCETNDCPFFDRQREPDCKCAGGDHEYKTYKIPGSIDTPEMRAALCASMRTTRSK